MMFFGETRSFLLLFCVIKATGQFLAIQPQSPAYVRTGEKLNLTCQSSQSKGTLAFHDFLRQDTKRTLGTVTYSFKECLKVPTVSDFVRCDFSTSTFILSLLTPVHNQTVFCQAVVSGTASTAVNTTIFVQVPVSDVILSPINTVAVDVGKEFTFRCTARGCRPKANIFWYRNKTLVPETSSNETLDSSLFDVESTLITTFENNETGTMIYCTAINIEGDVPKPSKTALINVKYAPSTEPKLTPINSSVDEGNWVSLRCYLPTLGDPAIIWRWVCGDDDLTMNARNYTTQSTLNFTANRKYDNRACQCWATSPRTSLSYNRSSVAQRITVFYAPLFPPNISAAMSFPVNERQLIILRCTLSSLANPIVLWRWVCGDDNLTKNATNTATESTLTFTADKKYHERKCQCWAMSTHISLAYNKSSDAMVITVFYAPSSPPKLNTDTSVPVHEGQPIMLQCSLSTLANPPITWRWVCGEENLIPEKLHNDTQSTLNFTANRKYNQKTCQCWATSPIISLSYNQSSKAKIITVYWTEKPSEDVVRITVRGIPLSVDDTCIKNMLEKLGAILTSDIKYEKIRNPNTFKMTEILNGNRFVYMKPMEQGKFLPKSSECAGLKCSIFHKGQPTTKRSILCTNCWGDDHLRFNCEYETCCKVCKNPGHSPGDKACSKYDPSPKDIIAFSGKDDVMSNFYPCDIKIFGISHASAEHAFQYSKAMRSGDLIRASSVRNAATALEAKRIGTQVTVPDHWIQQREDIMRKVLEAKFDQVIEFRDKISATGSSTLLVEAAFDDYWGSGLDKKGTMYTGMKAWPGKNTMGQILTDIGRSRRPNAPQRKQSVRNQKNRS